MEKQFVTFEIALALKEVGFNEPTLAYTYKGNTGTNVDVFSIDHDCIKWNSKELCVAHPLWQQVEEWLRELHNIQLSIFPDYDGDGIETVWDCNIINLCWGPYKEHHIEDYIRNSDKDRSKCLETAILRALELLTTKIEKYDRIIKED